MGFTIKNINHRVRVVPSAPESPILLGFPTYGSKNCIFIALFILPAHEILL